MTIGRQKEHTKDKKHLEVVGNTNVDLVVNQFMNSSGHCFNFDYWSDVKDIINNQLEFEVQNKMPSYQNLKIQDVLSNIDNWKYMLDERYKYIFKNLVQ